MHIPICDPKLEYLSHKAEIDAAIHRVLEDGNYILGPNVASFESEFAEYLDCPFAVGVNSGTDALHLALRSLEIGPGDEVITSPFMFIATTEAIGMVGATPVFADIDPRTFNVDPQRIAEAITPRTKAIMPVHLFGAPCDMDAILTIADQHKLFVIEDCAQATGAMYRGTKVGTLGTIGCFSFFPTKNLSCCGDGGMVVSKDEQIHQRLETLRRHGARVKYHHSRLGINSRLDEIQAAILRIKLKHLDYRNRLRRNRATRYRELLADAVGIHLPESDRTSYDLQSDDCPPDNAIMESVYHQYTVILEDRELVRSTLTNAGIGNAVYYPVPLHLQEVHRDLNLGEGAFPVAEDTSKCCLSLPMFPDLQVVDQKVVAETIVAATRRCEVGGKKKAG